MTFDGPGRQAALWLRRLVLRPDWEAVLTPVADAMAARPDVDAARMALIGAEHAGYGVARALAFDDRFAAAVAAPGVVDVSTLWTDALPQIAREALVAGDRPAFNREIHLVGLFDPRMNDVLRRRGAWYGLDGRDAFDLYQRVRAFALGDEAERIATPLLVREHTWLYPGQSRELLARVRSAETSPLAALDWIAARL
jgi:hypothetical protein